MYEKITGSRLKESFLVEQLKRYESLKPFSIDITFQEYIEFNFAPTIHVKDFFIKNNLPFNDAINDDYKNLKRFHVQNEIIMKELQISEEKLNNLRHE